MVGFDTIISSITSPKNSQVVRSNLTNQVGPKCTPPLLMCVSHQFYRIRNQLATIPPGVCAKSRTNLITRSRLIIWRHFPCFGKSVETDSRLWNSVKRWFLLWDIVYVLSWLFSLLRSFPSVGFRSPQTVLLRKHQKTIPSTIVIKKQFIWRHPLIAWHLAN